MKKSFSSLLSRKEEQTQEDVGNAEEFGGFFFLALIFIKIQS